MMASTRSVGLIVNETHNKIKTVSKHKTPNIRNNK